MYMNTKSLTNNERLRELVEASGLTQAVVLTVFNRGLGPAAYSESAWKAFFVRPDSAHHQAKRSWCRCAQACLVSPS